MDLKDYALKTLKQTSRTFYIPIVRLPEGLQEAVTAAYLCMRAIDEVEDHPHMDSTTKIAILNRISCSLQSITSSTAKEEITAVLKPYKDILPEVSYHIADWAFLAPPPSRGEYGMPPRLWQIGWPIGWQETGLSRLNRIWISIPLVWQEQWAYCCLTCGPGMITPKPIERRPLALGEAYRQ